jgi:photosystem II stability/assembly factor-like uncharacterized protein
VKTTVHENVTQAPRTASAPNPNPWPMRLAIAGAVCVLALTLVGATALLWPRGGANPSATGATQPPPTVAATVLNGRVYAATSGVSVWKDITPAQFGRSDLVAAAFISATTGWTADAQVTSSATKGVSVYRTSDGGASWQRADIAWQNEGVVNFLDLRFVDARHGWLSAALNEATSRRPGILFATSDGGKTWTQLPLPYGGSIYWLNDTTGWLAGGGVNYARNQLSVTHDGGKTWQDQPLDVPPALTLADRQVGTPAFFSATVGVLPVNYGAELDIDITRDGGKTWLPAATFPGIPAGPTTAAPLPFVSVSGQSGWVLLGDNTLYATHDGGKTWAAVQHGTTLRNVQSIGVTGETTGWVVTANGYCASMFVSRCNNMALSTTTDGGGAWTRVALP